MLKKVLLGAFVLILLLSLGLSLWVRAVFTNDNVRAALAEQLSNALGQPVKIGSVASAIYPRVTLNLRNVSIAEPARIHVQTLHVGADLRALLSRRIEHASLELSGARVELPLPDFSIASGSNSAPSSNAPVEIVSIDAIVLRGVAIVSGGRTLTGDVEVVPDGNGLTLRHIRLVADTATIDVTGQITDLSGPVGDVAINAGALSFDQLLAFANDFATGTGIATSTAARSAPARATNPHAGPGRVPPMNIAVSLEATRATMGMLTLDTLAGKARITADTMTLAPISFGVFGGRYRGSLVFTLDTVPAFKLNATLAGVDMAAATAFAGSPDTITGRLSGTLNLTGRGMDASSVTNTTRGTARVDIVDGVIKNLGLIRSVVVATSGRADAAGAGREKRDEPFTTLGATLNTAGGSARTEDLRLQSKDVLLAAAGTVRLDGGSINLTGQVQLSDELSKQAGRDLVRYTQEGGRVTLPVTITGSADAPHVRIDVASTAKRALVNRANEEAQRVLKKGLRGLFKK
jgi:uncharacterized protein involved in outer membrane biogenesis